MLFAFLTVCNMYAAIVRKIYLKECNVSKKHLHECLVS